MPFKVEFCYSASPGRWQHWVHHGNSSGGVTPDLLNPLYRHGYFPNYIEADMWAKGRMQDAAVLTVVQRNPFTYRITEV